MAENSIKHNEIIEEKVFQPAADSADVLLEKLSLLIGGFRELAKITGAKINSGIDPKTIGDVDKLTEAKSKLASIEKGLTDLERVQAEVMLKTRKARQDLNDQLKSQGGLLGDLIIKKKQLGLDLLSAKTTGEIKRVNQELFKTNGQIRQIKEGGTGAFNSWGNAIQSFQFKFNALGAAIGGLAVNFIGGLLMQGINLAIDAFDLFGKKAEENLNKARESTKKLILTNKDLKESLSNLNRGEIQNRIDLLNAKQKLDGESLESAKKISEEEAKLIQFNIGKNKDAQAEMKKNLIATSEELMKLNELEQIELNKQVEIYLGDVAKKFKKHYTDVEKIRIAAEIKKDFAFSQKTRQEQLKLQLLEQVTQNTDLLTKDAKLKNDLAINEIVLADHIKGIRKDLNEDKEKAAAEADKLLKERAASETEVYLKVRQNRIDALKGTDEEEKRINLGILRSMIADDSANMAEIKAVADYDIEQSKKSTDAQIQNYKDKADAQDQFVEYELEAIKGLHGKVEQETAKLELATKIALGYPLTKSEKQQVLEDNKKLIEDKQEQADREAAIRENLTDTLFAISKKHLGDSEADKKKRAELEQLERVVELTNLFFKAYASYLKAGDKSNVAMKKAMQDIIGAKAFGALIAGSFKEGTEDTGERGNVDSDGGKLAIVHPHERILTKEQNAEFGGISNADLVKQFNMFPKITMLNDESKESQLNKAMLGLLHSEMKGIRSDIKNQERWNFERNAAEEIVLINQKMGVVEKTTFKKFTGSYSKH